MLFGSKVIMFFFFSSSFKKGHQAALWSREVAMVFPILLKMFYLRLIYRGCEQYWPVFQQKMVAGNIFASFCVQDDCEVYSSMTWCFFFHLVIYLFINDVYK